MNVTREQTRDLREDRLYSLSHHHLIVLKRRFLSPLRVPLPANTKLHIVRFTRRILSRIVSVAAVHKDLASCSKLKRQDVESTSIASSTRQEGELYRYTASCSQYLHLHSIEVAPFGNAFAAKLLAADYSAASYTDVVTNRYGEAVEQVLGLRVGLFEEQSELMKEAIGQISHAMKSAAETRSAQHPRHKTSLLHKGATCFEVAAEVKSSGNHFGIRKITSAIIRMTNSFEQIVRDTVKTDNIVNHDPLLNSIGVDSEGIFSFSKSFANSQLATWINYSRNKSKLFPSRPALTKGGQAGGR